MGLREAKEYIRKLHERQDNPYNWPDYLTGLPDRAAVIKKVDDVYKKLGSMSIAYVRIANVHPYIIKYGTSQHADIIQWAAAILKTTASEHKGAFVGAVGTHEFIVICRTKDMVDLMKKASTLFQKKTKAFYSDSDMERKYILSFSRDGQKVHIGFMNLKYEALNQPLVEKHNVIPYLAQLSSDMPGVEN